MHCRCTDRHSFQAITLVDKDKPGENNKRVSQANTWFHSFCFCGTLCILNSSVHAQPTSVAA